jgi:hypothetical protein
VRLSGIRYGACAGGDARAPDYAQENHSKAAIPVQQEKIAPGSNGFALIHLSPQSKKCYNKRQKFPLCGNRFDAVAQDSVKSKVHRVLLTPFFIFIQCT